MAWRLLFTQSSSPTRRITHRRPLSLEALEERCVLSGDAVLEWNANALDALKNDSFLGADAKQVGPGRSSRALAIVHAAIFDAANSIARKYEPYLIQVSAQRGASLDAAVAQAAHDTLAALYPDFQATLDDRLAADLADIHSARSRAAGVQVGQTVAAAILAARSADGADADMTYTPNPDTGYWRPDPLHPGQTALGPQWGEVTPFALQDARQFPVAPPPALTSPEYTTAFNEAMAYGGDGLTTPTIRTPEQTTIGVFWGYDGSRGLSTPPRLYNQIAATLAVQQHNTEIENARFFALVNLALADAGIACWAAKYDHELWRPVTALQESATDGNDDTNADPNWLPLGAPASNDSGTNFTPPFPAYASGHATFGGAFFRTMANFYGRDEISFTVISEECNGVTTDQFGQVRPPETRSFTRFSQAAEENGQSRIYLGIHWSFDKVEGIRQGSAIADYVFQNYLRPRHGHGQDFAAAGNRELGVALAGAPQNTPASSGVRAEQARSTSDNATLSAPPAAQPSRAAPAEARRAHSGNDGPGRGEAASLTPSALLHTC